MKNQSIARAALPKNSQASVWCATIQLAVALFLMLACTRKEVCASDEIDQILGSARGSLINGYVAV
jgi:hypothetical protein